MTKRCPFCGEFVESFEWYIDKNKHSSDCFLYTHYIEDEEIKLLDYISDNFNELQKEVSFNLLLKSIKETIILKEKITHLYEISAGEDL